MGKIRYPIRSTHSFMDWTGAEMEKGKFEETKDKHCEYCGKFTLFLIKKENHEFCPNCAGNPEYVKEVVKRAQVSTSEQVKKCQRCEESKKDVRYRRARDLFLCNSCAEILAQQQKTETKEKNRREAEGN